MAAPENDIKSSETEVAKPEQPEGKPSPTKQETDIMTQAMHHLASGKRNLAVQDVNAAVSSLESACKLLGEQYGEMANECGEAYFYYGKALLELARLESGVLANAFDGEESEENSEDDETEEETKPDDDKKDGEDTETDEKDDDEKDGEDKEEDKKDAEEKETESGEGDDKETESIASNDAGTSDKKDEKDATEIEQEEVDDPSNLQLAWEMFELAKTIFKRHADSLEAADAKRLDLENRLSETYQLLGEVSIENENYPQAIEDLTSCLRRRQEFLPEDSREVAVTHYQLGVAQGFNLEFDAAVSSLNDAIHVLETRIKNLLNGKASADPTKQNDAFYSSEREIDEIKGLLPEIKEKITDTLDMKEETLKKIQGRRDDELGMSETNGAEASSSNNGEKSKPVSNISHLIKKRKKSDEDGAGDAKKPHLEANGAANGSATA